MIALSQSILVFALAFVSFRLAISTFVLLIAFSPRSLGFLLGGAEFSLTFVRLTFPVLITLYLVSYFSRQRETLISDRDLLSSRVFLLIFILGIYKIATSLYNGVLPLYALENLLFSAGPFALFFLASTEQVFRSIVLAVIVSCILIVIIVSFEYIINQPLHFFIANPILFQEDLLSVKITDRGYRVQAIFDNSLSLAEYLMYALPLVLFVRTNSRGGRRLLLTLTLSAIIFSGFLTGSRGFILFGSLTLFTYWYCINWHRFSRQSKVVVASLLLMIIGFALLGAGFVLVDFVQESIGIRFNEIDDAAERSTLSRALQFYEVFQAVSKRPFAGFGVLQNFSDQLSNITRIDNYYLRTALEAGFVGLFLFILLLGSTFSALLSGRNQGRTRQERAFFAMSMALLVAFLGAKVFLSMPTNNFLFYAFLGLVLGMKLRRERTAYYANSTSP